MVSWHNLRIRLKLTAKEPLRNINESLCDSFGSGVLGQRRSMCKEVLMTTKLGIAGKNQLGWNQICH
jgi:hypothetical protein